MKKTPFKLACEKLNTTPSGLGRKLGINTASMRYYASGERTPMLPRAKKLAKSVRSTVEILWPKLKK